MFHLSDQRRRCIVEFTSAIPQAAGEPLPWRPLAPDTAVGSMGGQSGLAASPGLSTLLVADTGNNWVVALDTTGGPSAVTDPALTPVGPLHQPEALQSMANSRVLSPCSLSRAPATTEVLLGGSLDTPDRSSVGAVGTGQGQFLAPTALCFGPAGPVLVSDPAARRLIVSDSADPLTWEEILLPARALPRTPYGLTPGGDETVLITDLTGGRGLPFDADTVTVLVDGAADRSLLTPVAAVRSGQDLVVAAARTSNSPPNFIKPDSHRPLGQHMADIRAESLVNGGSDALCLLGGFRLTTSAGPERVGDAGQRLLVALALEPRACSRDALAGRLWPEQPQGRAMANLRSVLWRLPKGARRSLICAHDTNLLRLGEISVDVRELSDAVRALLDGTSAEPASLTVAQLSRELLPGWSEDWIIVARERLRQLRLHGLEALCVRSSEAGAYYDAVEAGSAAIEIEPLRESAHRTLIRAHLAAGNRYEAMHQYEMIVRLLRRELGVAPSARTRELLAGFGNVARTGG